MRLSLLRDAIDAAIDEEPQIRFGLVGTGDAGDGSPTVQINQRPQNFQQVRVIGSVPPFNNDPMMTLTLDNDNDAVAFQLTAWASQ